MKTLVLSAMICAASWNSGIADTANKVENGNKEIVSNEQKDIDTFMEKISFHQRNVEVLWKQYSQQEEKIKQGHGNHQELDRDFAYFEAVYLKDIAEGKRVGQSKRAIAELKEIYAQKHAARQTYENKKIAKLQAQLKVELNKEKKNFSSLKKAYAHLVNEKTLPLLLQVEQRFGQSNDLVTKLDHAISGQIIASL